MIASLLVATMLICGARWPGVLVAGALFTYQASVLSGYPGMTPIYTIIALTIAVWKARHALGRLVPSSLDITFALFLAVHCCSAAYAPSPPEAFAGLLRLGLAAGSMFLLGRLCALAVPPGRMAVEIAGGMMIFGAAFAGVFLLGSVGSATLRLQIDGATAVGTAQPFPLVLTAGFLAMVAALSQARPALFMISCVATLICLHASIVSGTRGIFVALAAGLMMIGWLGARQIRAWLAAALVILVVAAAVPMMPLVGGAEPFRAGLARLLVNFHQSGIMAADVSGVVRMEQLSMGLTLWADHPLLGVGLGGYSVLTGRDYPHNIFVEVAAESGAVGLALLSIHLATLAWFLSRFPGPAARLLLSGLLVACLVHMQFSYSLFMAKPLFLLTGIAASWSGMRRAAVPPVSGLPRTVFS
ncbi:O-antigen ligase family protein [Mesorhizobium sp. CAU 1741]|uniref:O-antigen ligase family protein n=1 Tax=Mesorhizobium sp. CAU 1741 TaxID=3140366 RepID=UPI00325B7DB7